MTNVRFVNTHVDMLSLGRAHTHIQTCMHKYKKHTHTHTHTHIHTHSYTRTHKITYTYLRPLVKAIMMFAIGRLNKNVALLELKMANNRCACMCVRCVWVHA